MTTGCRRSRRRDARASRRAGRARLRRHRPEAADDELPAPVAAARGAGSRDPRLGPTSRSAAAHAPLHLRGLACGPAKQASWQRFRGRSTTPTTSSCSTSSPTSSSSAACRATRSRRTAPICSSTARSCSARGVDALEAGHGDVTAFLDELARGDGERRPGGGGDAPAQGCLPALVLPPPAPRAGARERPDRRPARAAQAPAAAAGAEPRRGRAAAGGAARDRAGRA